MSGFGGDQTWPTRILRGDAWAGLNLESVACFRFRNSPILVDIVQTDFKAS